jgi:two-component system sensor histidine kinase CreC
MRGKRTRILLGLLAIYALGSAFLLYRVLADLDPRYRESAEESLVETAQVFAALVEQDVAQGAIRTDKLRPLFDAVYAKRFDARIFSLEKQRVDLRLAVTDARGRVLFDSLGRHTGADFSQWRDVALALRGEYGARTTADDVKVPDSAVMYVAAPVRSEGRIVGAVSVGKPVRSFGQFVDAARRKTLYVGVFSIVSFLLLGVLVSAWLVRPFGLVSDYVRYLRTQPRLTPGGMWRRAVGSLRAAYDEMRDALAGRSYVADYVQTLTHELKSPLSAIRGAAELLEDAGMPQDQRQRFLGNIARETGRIQEVVDRMLELTALEAQRSLADVRPVALGPLLAEVAAAAQARAEPRGVRVTVAEPGSPGVEVEGDPFLLRRALSNLVDNAIDFSPDGGEVRLALQGLTRTVQVQVRDQGSGIPDYAQDQVFEKFYSLARPATGKKGTGLGLSFVQQIAALHRGGVTLANAEGGGALAILTLPRLPSR